MRPGKAGFLAQVIGLAKQRIERISVTRYGMPSEMEVLVAATAERMKAMRDRRRGLGLREVRLIVPDARLKQVKSRIAQQTAALDPASEREALRWIESVSEFDVDEAR